MEVLIAPRDFLGYDVGRVPIKERLGHEVLIVLPEQVSDVPVAMVVPLNLFVEPAVFSECQRLSAQLVRLLLFLITLLLLITATIRDIFGRLRVVRHDERLVSQFALVYEHICVPQAHHLLIIHTEATAVGGLLASKSLRRYLRHVPIAHIDVIELVPFVLTIRVQAELLLLLDV